MKNINFVFDPQSSGWDPLFLKELSGMSRIVSDKLRFNESKAISINQYLGGHFMFNINVGTTPANGYLTGGGSATGVFGTWEAVTDGEFTITIDGTAYDITAIDFTGVTDMDEVAAVIQAAIRAKTGNSYETCVWDTDHFIITGRTAVSVTSAVSGGSGTDISGAGGTTFLDAETGQGTATSGTNKKFGLIQLTKDIKALFFIQGATLVCITKNENGDETMTEKDWDDSNFTGENIKFKIDMTVSHSVKFSANDEQIAYHETYAPKGMMGAYINNEDADNMDISYIEGRSITDEEVPKNIRVEKLYTLLDGVAATGAGIAIDCSKFQHKEFIVSCAGMGAGDSMTIKAQGGSSIASPAFGSAKSASNEWDYIQLVDLEDGATVDGDVGVAFADSSDLRKFAINVDGLKWITANLTAISDAVNTTTTVKLRLYND